MGIPHTSKHIQTYGGATAPPYKSQCQAHGAICQAYPSHCEKPYILNQNVMPVQAARVHQLVLINPHGNLTLGLRPGAWRAYDREASRPPCTTPRAMGKKARHASEY